MNCIKSVYIFRKFGGTRLIILATFAMLSFFSIFYSAFKIVKPEQHLASFDWMLFVPMVLILYPAHKLLHWLPVLASGYKARISISLKAYRPLIHCEIIEPLPRKTMMLAVMMPATLITFAALAGALTAGPYMYYFAFAGAVNFGLCVTDFIYFVHLLKTPASALIEDFQGGFRILIRSL